MATVYWEPKVEAVAQIATGSIDSVDATPANNTFTVTIGGFSISVTGDTDVATTATNLRTALNASEHPYFAAVTWSGSSGDITGTADTAGCPFVAALTETGAGTGTVTDFSDTTANASKHDAGDADNWDGGSLPGASDTVVIADTSVSLLYGLSALSAVSLDTIRIDASFTGKVGLERSGFATSEDGETRDSEIPEYRTHYWDVVADTVIVGRETGIGTGAGSARVKIDNGKAGASLLRVENTATATDTSKPAVLYLAANASCDVEVASAPGGVGIASDEPDETSTVGDVTITDSSSTSRVVVGAGTTLTNFEQQGGRNALAAAATVTSVTVHGGELEIGGEEYTITTLTEHGGTVTDTHINSGGVEWTTITLNGGTLDLTGTQEGRTVTTLNIDGGTVEASWADLTVTTFDKPSGSLKSVTVSDL